MAQRRLRTIGAAPPFKAPLNDNVGENSIFNAFGAEVRWVVWRKSVNLDAGKSN